MGRGDNFVIFLNMNKLAYSAAIAALMNSAAAIKSKVDPDVYGPNGENYKHDTASYDLSRIGIDITEPGTGPKCKPGDWVTVHWVGTLKDGRVITDSHQEPGGGPKTFSLGAREVFHCWDLALTQLHQGAKAHLDCPSYFVYGGAFTWAPIGGEPIPLHSDVDFDIEVVECNRVPEFTEYKDQPVTTTMQPGRCMYLHSDAAEEEGTPSSSPVRMRIESTSQDSTTSQLCHATLMNGSRRTSISNITTLRTLESSRISLTNGSFASNSADLLFATGPPTFMDTLIQPSPLS